MFRHILTRISACPRPLIATSKSVVSQAKFVASSQSGVISPTKLLFNRHIHSGCILKPNIISRLSCVTLGGQPVLPSVQPALLANTPSFGVIQKRGVTKYSLTKGKRKSVRAVLRCFKRLNWPGRGIWIHARAGASKRMWKKSRRSKYRAKTHVFCNAAQSQMLDKMVTKFWRRPRHYPDDPYRPYMKRESFKLSNPYPREYF